MANSAIVVENGVIQCEHGGKVILKSTVPNYVIGGKKPLFDIDILGAAISGCPYNVSHGGQCTKVAAISSAVTETNVGNAGTNYLLRVDGCQTDKGAALVLIDPGQTNTHVKAPAGGSSVASTVKTLEEAKLDTKQNLKKEKYRIYPLRRSGEKMRALRGTRDFNLLKNYYGSDKSDYTHDKIVTYTDAYLYVKYAGNITEYKVLNRGDMINPVMSKVHFLDENDVVRKYIPFYDESGDVELVYSNINLDDEDFGKFESVKLSIGDKKADYVLHPNIYAKNVKHDKKEFKKSKLISKAKAQEHAKRYMNILVDISDPIGEVEDLYNEMESSFQLAYAHNKAFIDRVKERNAYAYSVASFMDDLELNSKEKQNRKESRHKLIKAYFSLVKGIKEDYLSFIVNECENRKYRWGGTDSNIHLVRLNAFVEHDISMSYFQQMQTNASFLLQPIRVTPNRRDHHKGEYHNTFDGERVTHLSESCIHEKSIGDYLCLGSKAFNYDIDKKEFNTVYGVKYTKEQRKNHAHIMAMLISSLYFSGKYDDIISDKHKDAMLDFHYNLKQFSSYTEFSEDTQKKINKALNDSPYEKLLKDKNDKHADTFLDDYEKIQTLAKSCAFEWEGNDKTQLLKFANLIPKNETFDFYFQKKTTTPKEYSKKIKAKLQEDELKTLLSTYATICKGTKDNETILSLLNIGYTLSASRTMFDGEVTQTSPFNAKSAVMDFLLFISKTLQSLDAAEHESLYTEEIFQRYHQNLHAVILHALIKGVLNEKDATVRASNVTKDFLDVLAPQSAKKFTFDLTNLNNADITQDLKVKEATEKLFEQLKAIDGITSQVHEAEDAQRKKEKKKPGSKKTKISELGHVNLRNSEVYKITIPALKGLSFLVALYQSKKILENYPKMTFHSLLDLSASINVLAKVTGEAAQTSTTLSTNARAYSIFKAMQNEELMFQRLLTKLAVPIVIFGAYHEIASLDDEDYDATVAISVKAAITVALILYATGIGEILVIGIAIELIWMKLSGYFIDSKIEVMIEKSLFYQGSKRKPYLIESLSSDSKLYNYKGSNKKIVDIPVMKKPKDVRDFIYTNYAEHKEELQAAFTYEVSSTYAMLKGVNIETSTIPKHYNSSKANYSVCSYISISKDFYKEIKRIVLLEDDKEIEITAHKLHNDKELIDLTAHLVVDNSSLLQEYPKKDTKLLLHSDTISLKYDVHYFYDDIHNYTNRSDGGALKITNLKSLPLTKDDCKILNIQAS